MGPCQGRKIQRLVFLPIIKIFQILGPTLSGGIPISGNHKKNKPIILYSSYIY